MTHPGDRPPVRWRAIATGAAVGGLAGLLAADLRLANLVSYWGDQAPLVAVASLVSAALWPSGWWRRPIALATALLAVLWVVVGFTPATAWLAKGLPRRDPLASADAVFVLGSRVQRDQEATAPALARLVRGAELIRQGLAPRLIVSEIPVAPGRHAALARRTLQALRIEAEVLAVGPVINTHDEAVALAGLCRQRGWSRILIVTSPVHSRRSSMSIEREGLEVISAPAVETLYDLENLDRVDERYVAFGSVLHERVGLFWYRVRGWVAATDRDQPGKSAPPAATTAPG